MKPFKEKCMTSVFKCIKILTLVFLSISTLGLKSQIVFSPVTYQEQTINSVAFEVDKKSKGNLVIPTADKGLIYFDQTNEFVNGPTGKENIWRLRKLDSDLEQEWIEELPAKKKHVVALRKMIEINDEEYLFVLFKDLVSSNSSRSVAQILQINTSNGESNTYPIESGRFEVKDILVHNNKLILPGYIVKSRWNVKNCIISTIFFPYALFATPDITPGIMESDLGSGNFELITDKMEGKHFYLTAAEPTDYEEPYEFYFMKEGKKSQTHSIVHFTTSRGNIKKPKEFDINGDLLSVDLKIISNNGEEMLVGSYAPKNEQAVSWKAATLVSTSHQYRTSGFFFSEIPKKGLAKTRAVTYTDLPSVVEYFNKHEKDERIFRSSKNPKEGKLDLYTMINDIYVDENEIVIMLEVLAPVYSVYGSSATGDRQAVVRGYRHKAFIAAAFHPETKNRLWDVTFIASEMIDKKPTKTVDFIKTEAGFLFTFSNGYQIILTEIENGKLADTAQEIVAIPKDTKKLIDKHSKNYVVTQWYDGTFVASGYKTDEAGSSDDKIFFISKLELTE